MPYLYFIEGIVKIYDLIYVPRMPYTYMKTESNCIVNIIKSASKCPRLILPTLSTGFHPLSHKNLVRLSFQSKKTCKATDFRPLVE